MKLMEPRDKGVLCFKDIPILLDKESQLTNIDIYKNYNVIAMNPFQLRIALAQVKTS